MINLSASARIALLAAIASAAGLACDETAAPPRPISEVDAPPGFFAGPVAKMAPADNHLTEARAQLGRRLFYDKRLSRTGMIACASCHQQKYGFADPDAVSTGVDGQKGDRNAPGLSNLAWSDSLFWDGRARTLEEQASKPIENPIEMDLKLPEAVARVAADPAYFAAFTQAYGGRPDVTTLPRALASFVRVLVSGGSRYDRFARGDVAAMDEPARRGHTIFFGERGECFHCHPPQSLTNDGFFNNGSFSDGGDPGRQKLTGRSADLGKFRVPGLRNIAASAPYMHDGSVATLEAVIEQYDRGGRGHDSADPLIVPRNLSAQEKADLLAFMRALTDDAFLTDVRLGPPD
jgi:cytochrome c peroxidase